MNFGDMKTALKRYGFTDDDPIAVWLNAAWHEFESAIDWVWEEEGPTILTVAAGSNTVTLPSDTSKVITLRDVDHMAKIKYWNRHKFTRNIQDQTDVGQIEVYTLLGNSTVQFWRVPQTDTHVEIVYQAIPPDLVNDSDIPGTLTNHSPAPCHFAVVQRAAAIALMAENEEERAKVAQSEYERSLLNCIANNEERELDEPTTVEDVQGYGGSDLALRGMIGW